MSEQTPFNFGKVMPGFDFLQRLAASGSGSTGMLSGLRHWVAPTVDIEEIEQRITELKAVQFWLEQNLMALKATVQTLEVQKMTLETLRGMNMNMAEIARAFTLPRSEPASEAPEAPPASTQSSSTASRHERWPYPSRRAAASPPAAPAAEEEKAAEDEAGPAQPARKGGHSGRARQRASAPAPAPAAASSLTDPMQWWGALTQQFQQIAAQTLRDAAQAVPAGDRQSAAEPAPAAPKPPRKKAAARKKAKPKKAPARKTAAGRKGTAAAKTREAQARPAEQERSTAGIGWPLPMPFKLGSR